MHFVSVFLYILIIAAVRIYEDIIAIFQDYLTINNYWTTKGLKKANCDI